MSTLNGKFSTKGKAMRFIAYLVIIIVFIAVVMIVAKPRQEESVFDADPSISYAHGTFIWEDGISEPDTEYLLDIQNHYILKYQENLTGYATNEANRIKSAIYDVVSDDILANGLYLDWLIDQAEPERISTDSITINALRWYYISNIQDDPLPSIIDGYWTKGIDINLVWDLKHEGLDLFEEVNSADSDYRNACISAGVPVPETLFEQEWESFGILGDLLGNIKPHTDLEIYLSEEPAGF